MLNGAYARNTTEAAAKWVYISGPMSGLPQSNYPAFYAAEDKLVAEGYNVVNPAVIGAQLGFPSGLSEEERYKRLMIQDLQALLFCDAIFLLPGWENSKGAKEEKHLADFFELDVIEGSDIE